jgi:4-amino-4-deoxy-L-arabinose transferase-like glycosyltransferase
MWLAARRNPLPWILLSALVLRVVAAVWLQHDLDVNKHRRFLISGDAEGYWELGRQIARGDPYELYGTRQVERMPGYPILVAASIRLTKELGLADERQYLVARLLMALVGTLNCALVALLGGELFDARTGKLAAAIVAVAPPLVGFSVILLSETLFATGLLVSLWCMSRLVRNASHGVGTGRLIIWAALTGLSIAEAVYVRPSWLLAAPCFAAAFGVWLGRKQSVAQGVVAAAVVVLAAYGALLPWAYRNFRATDHWVFTTLWVGPSLYDGFNPSATGDSDLKFVDEDRLSDRMVEYEIDRHYRAKAWDYIREHPRRAAWLTVEKLKRFWMPWPNAKQFDGLFLKIVIAAYFVPVLLAAGLGWLTVRRNFWGWTLTLGPLLYFCAVHAVFLGSLRYRLPAEYPLCIASAVGLQQVWKFLCCGRLKQAGQPPASPSAA